MTGLGFFNPDLPRSGNPADGSGGNSSMVTALRATYAGRGGAGKKAERQASLHAMVVERAYEPVDLKWTSERCTVCNSDVDSYASKMVICVG